jgi:hypothetical protein
VQVEDLLAETLVGVLRRPVEGERDPADEQAGSRGSQRCAGQAAACDADQKGRAGFAGPTAPIP